MRFLHTRRAARSAARRPAPARPAAPRAAVEPLESRQFLSAASPAFAPGADVVYVETNNPLPGGNAVLAFRRDPATGTLAQVGDKPYYTAGTGVANPTNALGPDDSDKEVVLSPDKKFLYAVNQGSGTVAAFRVNKADGSLKLIGGSAFKSGGTQPVSLSFAGNKLYVLSRGDEIMGQKGTVAPNLVGFKVGADGRLARIAGATVTFAVGTSPAQVLVVNDGKSLFVDLFTPPPLLDVAGANTIAPFKIKADGTLSPAGKPVGTTQSPPLVLGLAQHPSQRIVYAGLVGANKLGVFTYAADGSLAAGASVPNAGGAICWLTASADGKWLYTADSGTDSVGVYSLADPLHPVEVQELTLNGPRNAANDPTKPNETVDFQLELDPSGKTLYVVNHQTSADGKFADGNQLHALTVNADGTVAERLSSPLKLPAKWVPAGTHPQGLAVLA